MEDGGRGLEGDWIMRYKHDQIEVISTGALWYSGITVAYITVVC